MKILIISNSFYPENSPRSFRATELAKEFLRLGHEVHIITSEKHEDISEFLMEYPVKIDYYGPLNWKIESKSKFAVIKEAYRKIGRFLEIFFLFPSIEIFFLLKKKLKNITVQYDVMISIAVPYPVHWAVAYARSDGNQIADIWIADCGDPFMGNRLDTFSYPFYFSYVEKWFCRKADFITVPTEGAISAYYPEFRNKIYVIPQGFSNINRKLEFDSPTKYCPSFAYAGGISLRGIRSPISLLKYLISKEEDFKFHFFITNGGDVINEFIKLYPDKIILHNPLPREELLVTLSSMDFVINFDNGTLHQLPSKLIDYFIIKRPILNIQPDNLNYRMIDEFLAGDYTNKLVEIDISRYDIANVCKKFLSLQLNRVE